MTGDTSYWRGLIRALATVESDVQFLLCSNTPAPEGIPDSPRVSWKCWPGRDRWWSLVTFPTQARKSGAKVLHTQYTLSPLAGRHGVTTIHDVSFFIGPEWFSPRDRLLLRWQVPASVRRAKRVLAVSETSQKEIERYIPEAVGKTRVTYNALGANIQPTDLETAGRRVDRLGIAQPYLLTVGTRWPRKNMALAVEAARMADSPLVVTGRAGWGDEKTGPKYTGYVSDADLTALYQCASLYLAPSFHEGFGIPLLEAFACRCPVLCSSGGALPEVAGDAAVIASTFEPAEWANRIRALLADSSKLDSMRERGASRLGRFDWRETARKTLDAYREAAD